MNDQVEMKLKETIMRYSKLKIGFADITDDSEVINDFGYDSVSTIRLVIDIEKVFGIEIDDEDLSLEKVGKYSSLKKLVFNKIGYMGNI